MKRDIFGFLSLRFSYPNNSFDPQTEASLYLCAHSDMRIDAGNSFAVDKPVDDVNATSTNKQNNMKSIIFQIKTLPAGNRRINSEEKNASAPKFYNNPL
jgi:hypothetical protein